MNEPTNGKSDPHSTSQGPDAVRGTRAGKVRPMILLWALGIPIPLILIILLVRSCI